MKVKELIEKLKEYDGNLDVVVQYRDGGWDYSWYDTELQFGRTIWIGKKFLKWWEKIVREYKRYDWRDMVDIEVDRLYL